ncbi:MAG: acyl-CoA dehydratase activase [Gemmatimonadota bacterium]
MSKVHLGIDVGSTTVKVVALGHDRTILARSYDRARGRPWPTLLVAVRSILARLENPAIGAVGVTGSGGASVGALIGASHVNELIAQARAVWTYHPEARTVIEIGGQDSKLLALERDPGSGEVRLMDFAMNAVCAAGTGAFLDQQAERLGLSIEKEFARLALASVEPARIAGRCTVFAKSDMIHLQQQGTPLEDILAGLCLALARNFKAVIGKGKPFTPPILFQGGVAHNAAVVRAFETVLEVEPGSIIVPVHHCHMPALGAAMTAMAEQDDGQARPFRGFEALEQAVAAESVEPSTLPRLQPVRAASRGGNGRRPRRGPGAYIGIDVGSISTCIALIDETDHMLAWRYLMTAGRPLEAVRRGLLDVEAGLDGAEVWGVGVTGSGRYLTGDFVGADVVRNEITAQARAAVAVDPDADTLFEIGGQDSKYVRLYRRAVVDFAMNHACAAGTGSFLEEQAERLRIRVENDFSTLAFAAQGPASLGERCTVFMESDLVHHQQQGRKVEDLTAGLAYSIAQNYLNRVVDGRTIGDRVLFQGGVASNAAVVAAFEELLGRPVTVPPHHRVSGAIGAAILAREAQQRRGNGRRAPTRFRGFGLTQRRYESTTVECRACPNLCQVNRVVIEDEPPVFYGARCDKFEEAGRKRASTTRDVPDLFAQRRELLLDGYEEPVQGTRPRVGIASAMLFHELFPFWRAFFEALDCDVVLSDAANPHIVRAAQETAVAETCFPVKLVFGHVANLLDKDIDYMFLPSVINRENNAPGQSHNQYCPFIPAISYLVAAHTDLAAAGVTPLHVALELSWIGGRRTQLRRLAPLLGVSSSRIVRAAAAGEAAQTRFYRSVRRLGRETLDRLDPDQRAVVLVGRPYNTHDPGATLDLPYKLRRLGALPMPMDFLPLESVDVSGRYPNMYWRSGQDILAAAEIIRDDPRLRAVYVTNFSCGPDSFLTGFFRRVMGQKPFLELEIDDHTADAGVMTRCEAFLESLEGTEAS